MKHPFTLERGGRTYFLVKHPSARKLPAGDMARAPWFIRFTDPTTQRETWRKVGDWHQRDLAVETARTLLINARAGAHPFQRMSDQLRYRQAKAAQAISLEAVETAYRSGSAGRIDPNTIQQNILSLRNLIRRATGTDKTPSQIPIQILDGDIVHKFKKAILDETAAFDDAARRSRMRTANSMMRHCRSIFSSDMRSIYRRDHQLEIPATIDTFMTEPEFTEVAKSKNDYWMPPDSLLHTTFTELEKLRTTNQNAYVAVWLAIGFGLRKEEIGGVRRRNFIIIQGQPILELEEVWIRHRSRNSTKNGDVRPRIPCTNGAWAKLEAIINATPSDDYLLTGTPTTRLDVTFRDISAWMRGLGWRTQKTVHEFRAYGGCQVAMRDGIYQCSKWMRHSSVSVTERHYARYIMEQITNAPLQLPAIHDGPLTIARPAGSAGDANRI